MRDTNRVTYVTLRFFMLRESFATLKLADRQNEKRKDYTLVTGKMERIISVNRKAFRRNFRTLCRYDSCV